MQPEKVGTKDERRDEPTPAYAVHLLVERALHHENPQVPEEIRNGKEFKQSLGSEIAKLLWREQADEAEEVVEDLHVPEEVLRSDTVHTAALHELSILESQYPQTIKDIIRLIRIFELSWDDVPEELRTTLQSYGHVPTNERGAI
jgi:hypothetical protein